MYAAALGCDLLSLIERYAAPESLGLDFGCGYGAVVNALRKNGFKATVGVDMSAQVIATGRESAGNCLFVIGEEPDAYQNNGCSFILCRHVIEHVANLAAFGQSLLTRIDTRGLLFLVMPNGGFLPAYLDEFKRYDWAQFPMHLHYFTPQSIQWWLASLGFDVLHMSCGSISKQTDWMSDFCGVSAEVATGLCKSALVDRELVVVAQFSNRCKPAVQPAPIAASEPAHLDAAIYTNDQRWQFLSGPNPGLSAVLSAMTRTTHPVPTFRGSEEFCLISSEFLHPGREETAVVTFAVDEAGIYLVEVSARLLNGDARPVSYAIRLNDETLAESTVSSINTHLRVPVRAGKHDKICIACSAPLGNTSATVDNSISVSRLFCLSLAA